MEDHRRADFRRAMAPAAAADRRESPEALLKDVWPAQPDGSFVARSAFFSAETNWERHPTGLTSYVGSAPLAADNKCAPNVLLNSRYRKVKNNRRSGAIFDLSS